MTKQIFDIVLIRDYTDADNQQRSASTRVGTAFPNKNTGFSLLIEPGVSISGRVQLLPRTEKPADQPQVPTEAA